jgi:DNA-binding MarR family transcriptional regulator
MSELPLHDTPTAALIAAGHGGPEVDREAVALCMDLLRTAKKTLNYFYARFQRQDLSPGKYSVLLELFAEGGALSASELALRVGVSGPTITGVTDRLAKQGYVRKTLGRADRRTVSIRLTAKGRSFVGKLLPDQLQAMARVVSRIPTEDQQQLRDLLGLIESSLEEMTSAEAQA